MPPHPYPPIRIIGNAGLGIGCVPNTANGVTSGCGTGPNPYIIENLIIDGTTYSDVFPFLEPQPIGQDPTGAIDITGTTSWLIIRNVTITGFSRAQIDISSSSNIRIENSLLIPKVGTILSPTQNAISIRGGSNVQLVGNTVACPGPELFRGINVEGGSTNLVASANRFEDCTYGIRLSQSTGSAIIRSNEVDGAGLYGLGLGAPNLLVEKNTVEASSTAGIHYIGPYSNVTITHNLVTANSGVGIRDYSSGGARIEDNIVSNNAGGGIDVGGGDSGAIYGGNNIFGNTGFGMRHCSILSLDWRGNWWGDSSGPSGLGSGTGDAITECDPGATDPLWSPWLTSANSGAGP